MDTVPVPNLDQDNPKENSGRLKSTQPSQKAVWIITYGASGPYITPIMLKELGNIEADECHSTKDRALMYTYLHLVRRVRQSSIEKFMLRAKDMHGIVKNEIFGYESIAGPSRSKDSLPIREHLAFKMLVKHYVFRNPDFRPCTDGEPILKRGLILKATEIDLDKPLKLAGQTKAKVIEYAEKMESKIREFKKMEQELHAVRGAYMALSDERSSLRVENASLKRKIQELETVQQ
jgi:hypothetical protein